MKKRKIFPTKLKAVFLSMCMVASAAGGTVSVSALGESSTSIRLSGSDGRSYSIMLYREKSNSILISDMRTVISRNDTDYKTTVTISNADGKTKYSKTYRGNTSQKIKKTAMRLAIGDIITVSTSYADGVVFSDYSSGQAVPNLALAGGTTYYQVTENGLIKLSDKTTVTNDSKRKAVLLSSIRIDFGDYNNLRVMERLCKQNYFGGSPIDYESLNNPSKEEFAAALDKQFKDSTDDSVNYLMMTCHGDVGRLYAFNDESISTAQLRQMLDKYKGKFVFVVDACYSGSLIIPDGENQNDKIGFIDGNNLSLNNIFKASLDETPKELNEKQEAMVDKIIDDFTINAALDGDFADTPKYNVICAASNYNSSYYNVMSYGIEKLCESASWDFTGADGDEKSSWASDTNSDGTVTFRELAESFKTMIPWPSAYFIADGDLVSFIKPDTPPFHHQIVADAFFAGDYEDQPLIYLDYNKDTGKLTYDAGQGYIYRKARGNFLTIEIVGSDGRQKLFRNYGCSLMYNPETEVIDVNDGDKINITAVSPGCLNFNNPLTNKQDLSLLPEPNVKTTYTITQNGFVKS